MRQEEEMYNEKSVSGGANAFKEKKEKDYAKYIFYVVAVLVIAASIVLAII